jgi:HAE1 family hydrophobic/amphiphilic exporter-1
VIIILIFLHDFRATLISAVAIPTSVVATFAFISVMGFTFNNMTMLALSLSIGILIDDAIVVIENIHRHLEMGKPPMQAAREATGEIGLAVLATDLLDRRGLRAGRGDEGHHRPLLLQFGLTVSFAVLVSLLVSFTLTPMLSSRFLRHAKDHRPNRLVRMLENGLGKLDQGYRWLLGKALHHRFITMSIAVVSLVGSCALVTQVKTEFVPPEDRSLISVSVELPTGTSLEASTAYIEALAADLRANAPGAASTFVSIGAGTQGQVQSGQIQVNLTPRKTRKFRQQDVMAWIRERYAPIKSAVITVNEINMIGGDSGFRSQPVQFNIRGRT